MSFLTRALQGRQWTQRLRFAFHGVFHRDIVEQSRRFWLEQKGKYQGRRGFIIGNGPSLAATDLERIKNDVSIASNRISLIYPQTNWRPTMVTCSDRLVWHKHAEQICKENPQVVITSNLHPLRHYAQSTIFSWLLGQSLRVQNGFSFDQSLGCFGGYTVTFINLQIAAHLGLNPIYIIGCDHYYGSQQHAGTVQSVAKTHGTEQLHFHKDYRKPGEVAYSAPIELMNSAYVLAATAMREHDFKVFNATRGGYLEAFDRVNFDEIASVG